MRTTCRRRAIPLHNDTPAAVRRFWLVLWTVAVGLILLLCFATLRQRPFDPEAVRHFPLAVLERGRQFSREVSIAATIRSLLSLGLMLALCFHPVGTRVLRWLERQGRGRFWLALICVALGVTLLTSLVELPFSFYLGHLHEKAYGLSRQSAAGWFADYGKHMLLSLALSLPLWIPLYWLMRRWPRGWWLPGAAFNIAVSGLFVLIYPVVIMPLFNHMSPVKDPQIAAMIHGLANRAQVRVEAISEMKVSDKTSRVNAMVTGLGPTKLVILLDTLLQQFSRDEVEVVMAHELAHAAYQDVVVGWLASGAGEVAVLCIVAWALRGMVGVGPLRLAAPHSPRGLAVLLLLFSLIGEVTSPVQNIISRRAETRADRFAITVTGKPQAFVSSFKKLAAGNPGDVDPPPLVEFLSYSHPSIINRLRAATQMGP
jgi:STE24 endopeptidase